MKSLVFLDTSIFFQCVDFPKSKTVLEHAIHAGYQIRTSISVLGEVLFRMHEKENAMDYIIQLNQALDDWSITVLLPNDYVRILCFQMGEEEIDTRIIREPTDRTHLAYAMAYKSDYFLTSDKNLIKYRIPSKLREAGFFKPESIPLDKFRDNILNSHK